MTALVLDRSTLQSGSFALPFRSTVLPGMLWRRGAKSAADPWATLSRDLIERFIDVACYEHGMSRSARRTCRADLVALDRWLAAQQPARSLVSARDTDLRAYFRLRVSERWEPRLLDCLLASMHAFYRYLYESGCREDNPARRLPLGFVQYTASSRAPLLDLLNRSWC